MKPLEDRVIIIPDEAPKKTEKGLIIPDSFRDQHAPASGTVFLAGPGKTDKIHYVLKGYLKPENEFVNGLSKDQQGEPLYSLTGMPLKQGDRVLYSKQAGLRIQDPETKKYYLIMRLTDIFIVL